MVLVGLQSEEFKGAKAAGAVPAEFTSGAGVVGVSGAVEDADDEVVDGGQKAGCVAGADAGGVFAVGGVAAVVQAVMSPMAVVRAWRYRSMRNICWVPGQRVLIVSVASATRMTRTS